MSARRSLCVLVVSLFSAASLIAAEKAKWAKAPDGFRGVKFGATKQEAEAVLGRMRCTTVSPVLLLESDANGIPKPAAPAHTQCSTADESKAFRAGEKIVGTDYIFDENRFVAVRFRRLETMRPSKVLMWTDALPVFVAEYGEPGQKETKRSKGTRKQSVSTWDPKQNKSVSKTSWVPFDFETTCATWDDPKVQLHLCSQNDLFSYGTLDSAAWSERKSAWSQSLLKNAKRQ